MFKFFKTILFAGFLIGAANVAAAKEYQTGDRFLSHDQLSESGPVTVKISGKASLRILSLSQPSNPSNNCKLDVPAFKKMVAKRVGSKAWTNAVTTSEPITFELKAIVRNGEAFCIPGGKGCVVRIEPTEDKQ